MTYKQWLIHFRENQNHFDHLSWNNTNFLTDAEKQIISSSIQQFQKGENSEGKNLFRYAKELNDSDYLETIKLFIKEEQSHALILGKFMEQNNISKIKEHWIDDTFRLLRKLASLENSIKVLITAEIIAAIYYKALRNATNAKVLMDICDQILIDEEMHINFQSFTLKKFYDRKSFFMKIITRFSHRVFMFGTTLIVWAYHKKVFMKGGFQFLNYFNEVFDEYSRAEAMISSSNPIELKKVPVIAVQ